MAQSLTDLLASAAVRIEIGGVANGTGFFISPTHVVTCTHVLDEYLSTSAGARPTLALIDSRGNAHEVTGVPKPAADPQVDLALLQLAKADTSVPFVLLDDTVDTLDDLASFGFPERHPEGEPTTFQVEGTSGGTVATIKFKDGQVRPGMSGSALLNLRTGGVCGVVRKTRNERTDLGGYGVRVSALHAAFEEVPKLNSDAHRADPRWLSLLSADQRRRMSLPAPAAGGPAQEEYVIRVSQAGEHWQVEASAGSGGAAGAATGKAVQVDLNTVRAEVPRLLRAWKAQGRINEAEQSRLLGHVLYRAILPEEIGATFEQRAFVDKVTVHLGLCFDADVDADLAFLPWEQLFLRGQHVEQPLGATTQASLTRVRDPQPDSAPPAPPSSAGVLVVQAPIDGHPAVKRASAELVRMLGGLTSLVPLPGPAELSLDDIEARLTVGDVSVLHYVGYGQFTASRDGSGDELAFANSDPLGDEELVGAGTLADALRAHPPTLVVLQTCGLAEGVVPADPTALAMTLVDAGVQAVVAFPYPLTDELAGKAWTRMYEQLDAGAQIRVAVQDARRSSSLRSSPWSRPALFMARPSPAALVARR